MPTISNLLCGCGVWMRPKKNSITVEELFDDGTGYKLWDADLWHCEACGAEVVSGFAALPLAEHWQPEYAGIRKRRTPVYPGRVHDAPKYATLPLEPER